jgi:c-di-GMP-binding flagellar brake protein YcgR
LEVRDPFDAPQPQDRRSEFVTERRNQPRFDLEVSVRIYPRGRGVARGHTVDISQSGIAVMLVDEIPTGEVVRIEFTLPLGKVDTHDLVCQRNAFRYGLQFLESAKASDVIGQTCRQLALELALFPKSDPTPL